MVNQQCNDEGLRELALFAGAGGGILGGKLLGWRTVCSVEYNAYARSVLLARQNDGTLSPFPVLDDVRTFDGKPWRGIVDVVSGGFPCQDISSAGAGAGIEGKRSGLWSEMARIICEVRPRFVFVENSPMLTSRGLGRVLGDLASLGFNAEWGVLSASDVGANHERDRIWIIACHSDRDSQSVAPFDDEASRLPLNAQYAANANMPQCQRRSLSSRVREEYANIGNACWWENPPDFHGMDDGLAFRMDRLKAIGNGQVSRVAATAWRILSGE